MEALIAIIVIGVIYALFAGGINEFADWINRRKFK